MNNHKQAKMGQVLLIILLVTTVGLTVGLSLVSRAINDVKISTQVSESSKAFSAAESGIEQALSGAATGGGGSLNLSGAQANYNVIAWGGTSGVFPLGTTAIAVGNAQTLWLVEHGANGPNIQKLNSYQSDSLDVCWGSPAGMELTFLYYDTSPNKYGMAKTAYDSNSSRTSSNHFTIADGGGGYCGNMQYRHSITFSSDFGVSPISANIIPVLLRINPVYSSTTIALNTNAATLPTQGKQITSTGTTTAGVARKINVLQGYSTLPSVFDYTLFVNL